MGRSCTPAACPAAPLWQPPRLIVAFLCIQSIHRCRAELAVNDVAERLAKEHSGKAYTDVVEWAEDALVELTARADFEGAVQNATMQRPLCHGLGVPHLCFPQSDGEHTSNPAHASLPQLALRKPAGCQLADKSSLCRPLRSGAGRHCGEPVRRGSWPLVAAAGPGMPVAVRTYGGLSRHAHNFS